MSFNSKIRRFSSTAALAAVALAGVVSPAIAQDRTAWLQTGSSTNMEGFFVAGEAISGTCDSDCYDMDLYLYDSRGNLVDSDTLVDNYPVVVAPYDGDFTVHVTMPNCSHPSGCSVAVSSEYGF